MRRDQEAERAQQSSERAEREAEALPPAVPQPPAPPPRIEEPPAPPPDPFLEAINARWDEFEAQDYAGQIALFTQTLNEPELMDDEMAYEMLSVLYFKSVEHNDRDRYDALVDALRQRLPAVYEESAHYYLERRITNALVAGRGEIVSALANEIAASAGREIDTFNNVLDQLAYHGQLSVLVKAMRIAWPLVKGSGDIVLWGSDEFAARATDYVVFDYLEHTTSPDANDPELIQPLEFYASIERERLTRYLACLTGQANRRWTMSDFELKSKPNRRGTVGTGQQNLLDLSAEFLGYLRREENVPYTRGEMARENIQKYILDRYAGELAPRPSMLEAALYPQKHKSKPRPPKPEHLLCPDRSTLDLYLGRLMHFINPQQYKLAATIELAPAWLRFLESRQLIDAQQHARTLSELHGLDAEVLKLLETYVSDSTLPLGTRRQWDSETLVKPEG
jgi:hypothetical protein